MHAGNSGINKENRRLNDFIQAAVLYFSSGVGSGPEPRQD